MKKIVMAVMATVAAGAAFAEFGDPVPATAYQIQANEEVSRNLFAMMNGAESFESHGLRQKTYEAPGFKVVCVEGSKCVFTVQGQKGSDVRAFFQFIEDDAKP